MTKKRSVPTHAERRERAELTTRAALDIISRHQELSQEKAARLRALRLDRTEETGGGRDDAASV